MPDTPTIPALEQQRERILGALATLGDMRPGSLVQRYMQCGRATCHCQQEGDPGHGPYFVFVRDVDGKRTSRSLSKAAAAIVQPQLAEYQRFRRLSSALLAVSEQLADARLAQRGEETPGALKKSLRTGVCPRHRRRARPLRSTRGGRHGRLRGARKSSAAASSGTGCAGRRTTLE